MGGQSEPISIEFEKLAPSHADDPDGTTSETSKRPTMIVAVLAVLAVLSTVVLVAAAISSRPKDVPRSREAVEAPPIATSTTAPPTSQLAQLEADDFTPWPELPEDHDPIVARVMGKGEPILGTESDQTLVYVNSLGRPTVVNLDTGDISSLIIAPTRTRDSFTVELGTVVSENGASRNLPEATARAITFYTFPEGPASIADGQLAGTAPGVLLCTSDLPCEVTGWQSSTTRRGADEFRRLTLELDTELNEALFGESWTVDGRYRYAPDGQFADLRLPVPLNRDVWVVHQPPDTSVEPN